MPTVTETPLTYPTYTNRNLDDGVFEQLMAAVKHHIKEEFDSGNIPADAYANVYLNLTEAVLQNATTYLLGILLIDEKKRAADLANQKAEYELEELLPAQLDKLLKEIELMDKQIEKMDAEISLLGKQEDKIDKEIEFMTAKILTEQANTQPNIADPTSLIGKQIALLTAQRIGFAGDIESKVAKLHADYYGIWQGVNEIEANAVLNEDTKTQIETRIQPLADAIAALT